MNNLLKIDHLNCAKKLALEALKLKKYKAMHPILAIFTGVFMLPFVALAVMFLISLVAIAYIRNICVMPIRAFHGLVNNEGKEVRHAPQTVIYIISWPIISLLYIFEAMAIPMLTIFYTCTSICTYICTLGGFKLHVFPEKVDDADSGEVKGRYLVLPIVFVSVCALLFIVMLIHLAIDYGNWQSWANYYGRFFNLTYSFEYSYIYGIIYALYTIAYTFAGFARRPREKKNNN